MVAIALAVWAQSLSARTRLWEALDLTVKRRKSKERCLDAFQWQGTGVLGVGKGESLNGN